LTNRREAARESQKSPARAAEQDLLRQPFQGGKQHLDLAQGVPGDRHRMVGHQQRRPLDDHAEELLQLLTTRDLGPRQVVE
jgi:hypothetical protein